MKNNKEIATFFFQSLTKRLFPLIKITQQLMAINFRSYYHLQSLPLIPLIQPSNHT